MYYKVQPMRIVGRIAFPLFAFMLATGMHKTHNRLKYLLKIGIMALIWIAITAIAKYCFNIGYIPNNIFLTLLAGGLFIAFIEKKKA